MAVRRRLAPGDPLRLQALREAGIMDDEEDETFDRLAELVRLTLDVPASMVSVVGADRQFFKGAAGLSAGSRETPLTESFCRHVVASAEPLIVEDARLNPLVSDHPAVSEPRVLAYAGIPLCTPEGIVVGSLCAIAEQPRQWSEADIQVLRLIATSVETQFALCREVRWRRRADAVLTGERRVLEALSLGSPLDEVLDALAALIEGQLPGSLCTVLLVQNGRLQFKSGPNMPAPLQHLYDGVEVGPQAGTCGTAAYAGEPVLTEDIRTSPLWDGYREGALAHGLRSCWSIPVFSRAEQVIGTFAVYRKEPSLPSVHEKSVMERAAHMAAIAIERTRGEEALRRSRERLSLILQRAPLGIILSTVADGRVLEANEAWLRAMGYARDEVIGRTGIELGIWVDPSERAVLQRELQLHGRVDGAEIRLRSRNGEVANVEAYVDVVDVDGEPCALSIHRDITEHRRAHEALQLREAHYRRLVENAPVGIYVLDPEGRFTEINPAGAAILGRSAAEIIGQPFMPFVEASDLRRAEGAFRRIISGDVTREALELSVTRPSGESRLLALTITGIANAEGVTGLHGIARDITGERRRDEQLRRAERLASVGTLVGGVAHELNNPLTAVQGLAELMLAEARNQEDQDALEMIRRESDRMARIVADLRQVARQTQEARRREAVDVNDVVRHVLRVRSYSLQTSAVTVKDDLSPQVGPVWADRTEIEQVLINLLVNAEQALKGAAATREPTVTVRTRPTPAGTAIHVVDNGPGVPPEVAHRIFDPFFTTKPPGEGTGLGLSLVHTIISDHGGSIRLDPAPGGGAEFVVDLPTASGRASVRRAERRSTTSADTTSLNVLVVDDEPGIRSLLLRVLRGRGHSVDAAANGEEALRLLRSAGPYQVLLSDLRMPGLGGEDLLRCMREEKLYAGNLIFMTGDAASGEAQRVTEELGFPVLLKPFSVDDAVTLVEASRQAL